MFIRIITTVAVLAPLAMAGQGLAAQDFVGSKVCADCHEKEYESFSTHSKKATSWGSIEKMASDLTPAEVESCYSCHTTGYGQGGFVSIEKTPHLSDVGCETCHGAGSEHAETGDPEMIQRKVPLEQCETCHNAERVGAFNYKPLIFGGAH